MAIDAMEREYIATRSIERTIELPRRNNVVPFRSDTIRLVQNECSFHGLWSEDPNQHLKDFLKLVDSLDLANREITRLHLFQFSLHGKACNWLERLLAGSISTWEDLTTSFLAQFFPSRRTAKLRNDILMFQQHQGESLSEAWTRFKDLLQKAISLPQDVPSASDRCLIDLENQVQQLMEAHLALKQLIQVKKISSSCEICSSPHDTQYCMENPEQAFVNYASSRTDKMGVLKAITDRMAGALPNDTVKNPKVNVNSTSLVLFARSYPIRQLQTGMGIGTQQAEEPEQTLEDEFKDLDLNLPVLEVLAHALMYNTILDKYVESLEVGKN
ncbi:MAK10-like protein, partial [Tanacetum coccineum]